MGTLGLPVLAPHNEEDFSNLPSPQHTLPGVTLLLKMTMVLHNYSNKMLIAAAKELPTLN